MRLTTDRPNTADLLRSLRVNSAVNSLIGLAPPKLRIWLDNQKLKAKVRAGLGGLVPEKELEQKYREAISYLSERKGSEIGDYLEFGVCHGLSMACMYRALESLGVRSTRLFGFDSFEGLPANADVEDSGVWSPGQYKSEYEFTRSYLTRAGVNWERVHLTKGWFSETLTREFAARHNLSNAGVIMVDCDLYSSSKEALNFCEPFVRDVSVVFFDDWHSSGLADINLGERKAFDELIEEHPDLSAEDFGTYGPNSHVFVLSRRV